MEEHVKQSAKASLMIHANFEQDMFERDRHKENVAYKGELQSVRQGRPRCPCICGCRRRSGIRRPCRVCGASIGRGCCVNAYDERCSCQHPQGDRPTEAKKCLDESGSEAETESEDQRNYSEVHASGFDQTIPRNYGSSSHRNSGGGGHELPTGRKFCHARNRKWCFFTEKRRAT